MSQKTRSTLPRFLTAGLLVAPAALAQGPHFLFTTTQPETTLSGSAGTVLASLFPNEIASIEFGTVPCSSLSAEKWAPRAMFHTQAGDADADDSYFEPSLFGHIDAVLASLPNSPVGIQNQRSIYYSVDQPMATSVSGPPGFRPGDIARIARDSSGADGKIEYFLRAEDVQIALGLPPSPLFVNVDAAAFGPNYGVFFSIEDDTPANTLSGTLFVHDGDVLVIPPFGITWNTNMTVASVTPGAAVVVHQESAMDAFVANARITDRFGNCVNQIGDTDAIEIDWHHPSWYLMPAWPGTAITVPHLIFAGETMTGAGVCNTLGGGSIHIELCGPLGTHCSFGPTLGNQMGLRPPTGSMGVASSVNGLCNTYVCRFVTEAQVAQFPFGSPALIDVASPGPTTWMFLAFAPSGPAVVAPSTPFPWGVLCYPDIYLPASYAGSIPTAGGFGTYASPPIPWPVDLVFFGITITTSGGIEASTPSTVEVF
ncbi:MAG: hypothetical protein Fur0037_07500 [Planctomycetota bacterium]